ncbi:MAG: chorismate--pyruvate lyase [Lachnospiraceae bacterium]|nr:chorismate--pyruvate lyase [Lachnospiraceae bacterium]
MFERIDYVVVRIDGDYAYLKELGKDTGEKCVARAMLPMEINEGSQIIYEMMEYRMA